MKRASRALGILDYVFVWDDERLIVRLSVSEGYSIPI